MDVIVNPCPHRRWTILVNKVHRSHNRCAESKNITQKRQFNINGTLSHNVNKWVCDSVINCFTICLIKYAHCFVAFCFGDFVFSMNSCDSTAYTGVILGMSSANEGRRYNVTSPPIRWTHTPNYPCHIPYDCSIGIGGIASTPLK